MGKAFRNICIAITLIISAYGLSGCYSSSSVADREQYTNPEWAPAYYPGVRYYYLPDIETYYDMSRRNFIYLYNGIWLYSRELPSMYRNYDLYNSYGVALSTGVYEPWRYHQQYVTSYPRYYYRNVYRDSNIRGYNENEKKPIYSSPDRSRRVQSTRRNNSEVNQNDNRETQPGNSNRRRVAQPAKEKPEMRQSKPNTPSSESTSRRQDRRSGSTVESDKAQTQPNTPSRESTSRRDDQKPSSTVESDKAKTNRRR